MDEAKSDAFLTRFGADAVRKPTPEFRLVANTLPEIFEAFEDLVKSLGRKGAKGPFRRLSAGNAINGVVCWFLEQSQADQLLILKEGVPAYTRRIDSDEPIDFCVLRTADDAKYTGLAAGRIKPRKASGAN
jgi:hypothetical protein